MNEFDDQRSVTIPDPRTDLRWIAVDFDGTLAEKTPPPWPLGAPIWVNIGKCNELYDHGWKIIIHTARPWSDYEAIEAWLCYVGVPFSRIVCGKLLAHRYIDDRNGPSVDAESWLPE